MQRKARHGSIHLMYFRVLLSILLSQISQTHRFVKRIGVHLLSLIACSWIRELNPQHSDKVRNKGGIFAWKNGESAFNENRKWSGWAKEWIKSGNLTGEMKQFWHYENVFCSTIVINAIYLIWTNDNEHIPMRLPPTNNKIPVARIYEGKNMREQNVCHVLNTHYKQLAEKIERHRMIW